MASIRPGRRTAISLPSAAHVHHLGRPLDGDGLGEGGIFVEPFRWPRS